MKRVILVIIALLMVSGGLFAQHRYTRGPREVHRPGVHGYYRTTPRVHGGIYIGNNYDFDYDYNIANNLYAMYGSEYRRARVERNSGILLTTLLAPVSAIVAGYGIDEGGPGYATIGIAGVVAGLGVGIPLWVDGQRKIDWMTDSYIRSYGTGAPGLRIGAGRNGFGISLNF